MDEWMDRFLLYSTEFPSPPAPSGAATQKASGKMSKTSYKANELVNRRASRITKEKIAVEKQVVRAKRRADERATGHKERVKLA